MNQIKEYLQQVVDRDGSDLHFIAGEPPRVRIYGELQILFPEILTGSKVEAALLEIMPPKSRDDFQRRDSTDFAYAVPEVARFRANVFRHVTGLGVYSGLFPPRLKLWKTSACHRWSPSSANNPRA